jgi:hypothetical protein
MFSAGVYPGALLGGNGMNGDQERILKRLLTILAGDDGRQTSLPEARRPSGNLARYKEGPQTFWQWLFGDRYHRVQEEHEFKRFSAEVDAETESHQMDIEQALALKRIKQEVERGAYAHQAQIWREVEELSNVGMGDLTRASKFRELVQLAESLDFDPLQEQYLVALLYQRFHHNQKGSNDGPNGNASSG